MARRRPGMWQRLSSAKRWGIVVAAAALFLAALNIWWVWTYRDGYPMDIDEAGYTTFGLVHYLGLEYGGIQGWWEAIQAQQTFAPLVPALTSLTVYVHPGVLNGFAVLTAFLLMLGIAVYGIAERLAGPRLGALAALVTLTLPGTFAFSREYIFALPVAALLACAVYALLRSDGLRLRRWALACGFALGLMLLARTMTIAYMPGVAVAATLVILMRGPGDLPRRFLNLALLIVTSFAVAATWYVRNLDSVVDYLTNYGYGTQSKFYGQDHALVSWGRLRSVAERLTAEDLFLPLATILLIGLVALAVAVVRRLRGPESRRATARRLASGDAVTVAIVFLGGYAALMTSQNGGNGFTLPLAIFLPPLAVLALRSFPRALIPTVAALALVTALNLVSTATIWADAAHMRLVAIPGFREHLPLTKGIPKAVFGIRAEVPGPETTFQPKDAGWPRADEDVADRIAKLSEQSGESPIVAFASRHRALSSNSVQLASVVNYHRGLPLIQMVAEPRDTVGVYADQLRAGAATVLITTSRNTGDFPPLITQPYAETAARRLGFRKIWSSKLPDGRRLYLWHKEDKPPKTAPSQQAIGGPDPSKEQLQGR